MQLYRILAYIILLPDLFCSNITMYNELCDGHYSLFHSYSHPTNHWTHRCHTYGHHTSYYTGWKGTCSICVMFITGARKWSRMYKYVYIESSLRLTSGAYDNLKTNPRVWLEMETTSVLAIGEVGSLWNWKHVHTFKHSMYIFPFLDVHTCSNITSHTSLA